MALVSLSGCQNKVAGPAARYTVLRFENLTGDQALEWTARAASEVLARMLDGALDGTVVNTSTLGTVNASLGARRAGIPGVSGERGAAGAATANHVITGYIARSGGGLRVVAVDEDLATHAIARSVAGTGKTLPEALRSAAGQLSSRPGHGITENQGALQAWAEGLEALPAEQAPRFERAIAADSGFGPAWVSLVRVTGRNGDRAGAIALADKAAAQKLEPMDSAALAVEKAGLQGDRKAGLEAWRKYALLNAGDVLLQRSVAEQETAAGEFAQAAASWSKVAAVLSSDGGALNQVGYNHAWAGNYEEAVRALKQYAAMAPADANPLDSLGDVNYWFGRFAEAASSYAAAHAKDPKLLNGGDLYKAAWAKMRAGDQEGADALLDQYLKFRGESKDGTVTLQRAEWRYLTGHQTEAEQGLRKAAAAATEAASRQAFFAELAVWNLVEGKREAAVADLQSAGATVTPATITARFAAMPSASAQEWETRAQRLFAQPQLIRLRDSALGWALILDGKKNAAKAVWEKIVAESPATDFFAREVLARLTGGNVKTFAPPDPRNVNQFTVVFSKL